MSSTSTVLAHRPAQSLGEAAATTGYCVCNCAGTGNDVLTPGGTGTAWPMMCVGLTQDRRDGRWTAVSAHLL